ncbi:MAG: hypothetical protein AAGI38_24460 [Bacteroidota bacterium]
MTKEEYLALAADHYDRIVKLKEDHDNFYDYELGFESVMNDLHQKVLEKSLGAVPKDRRKKKILTRYGAVALANAHPFSKSREGFRMSPRYQELLAIVGQSEAYHCGAESVKCVLGFCSYDTQIHRVSFFYGDGAAQILSVPLEPQPLTGQDRVDGSMIFVRQQGWKEVKLGQDNFSFIDLTFFILGQVCGSYTNLAFFYGYR